MSSDTSVASREAGSVAQHAGAAIGGTGEQAPALTASALSKCYLIYETPQDRLRQAIYPRIQRFFGRPVKQYHREFWALRNVSFEIRKGETVGIVGRNGAGKSTLLQVLCGTLAPTGGAVSVAGRVAALLELGSGFNPDFTGRENVFLNASVLGLSRQQISDRLADIFAFADIGDFVDQPVRTYSSGMYVRLAFAIIAHVDADILIVDEALAVGDAIFSQKCMRFLRAFQKKGTLLFVSHDAASVINLCERAIWLDHGSLRMSDSAKKVSEAYLRYTVQAEYGERVLLEEQQGRVGGGSRNEDSARADQAHPMTATGSAGDRAGAKPAPDVQVSPSFPAAAVGRAASAEIHFFDGLESSAGWKTGRAEISRVRILDAGGAAMELVAGGEDLVLEIQARVHHALVSPILGFFVKDRLGQSLFGEHTFNHSPPMLEVPAGSVLTARFRFDLPLLPNGDYAITVSIAEGTPQEHVQHHWLHDAMVFKVASSRLRYGLVGIPFKKVELLVADEPAEGARRGAAS
jgi:lipopolysaccharide transport system ATP-binding protein